MKKIIVNLFIFFVTQHHLPAICAQNIRCQKVDFNRPTSVVNEFSECPGESFNGLKINSYAATTIEPFRPTSEFHLSAIDEGLSCLQSTSTFTLDLNSEIRTAIYLSWIAVGAWVKVQILDRDGEQIDVMAEMDESDRWLAFYGNVNRSIENAQIEILTNMNTNSIMAIEYVYVLNSVELDDQCVDEDTEPPVTQEPTDEPTDEPTSEPTDEPTDETTDEPTSEQTSEPTSEATDDPTVSPTDESTNETEDGTTTQSTETTSTTSDSTTTTQVAPYRTQSIVWKSLAGLFLATTIITLTGIYYFIHLYRKLMSMERVTSENVEIMKTIPRLQVRNSVSNGDHVIVGIDKF